jgi:hypothetical protein
MVNQAIGGKKTIGTASPGKSSGFFITSGREIEMGIDTQANEPREKRRLKIFSPLVLNKPTIIQKRMAARKHTIIFRPSRLTGFITREKSTSVAKK